MNQAMIRASSRIAAIEADIEANGGIITEEQERELETIACSQVEDSISTIVWWERRQKHLEGLVKQAKVAIAFMENRASWWRARARAFMEHAGGATVKMPIATAIYSKGRVRVQFVNPDTGCDCEFKDVAAILPDNFKKSEVVYKPETDLIKAALESGMALPFARLAQDPFVTIRVNQDKLLEEDIRNAAGFIAQEEK